MSSIELDQRIRSLAESQHSLITTDQAIALGATYSGLRTRTRDGGLRRVAPRVLAIGGATTSETMLLHATLLAAGGRAAVAHSSAAALWRFPGFVLRPFQVARLRDNTFPPSTLGRVHTTRRLPDAHLAELDGMLVTTPTRTLFDLAATVHPERLENLIDHAWSRRLTSGALLDRTLRELAGRGQHGITLMRELLAVRGPDYIAPESNLEARFEKIAAQAGFGGFRRQVCVGDDTGLIGRVDFCHETRRVIVEIDSDLHHTSISDRRRDMVRRKRLEDAGWTVVSVTEFEIWHRPEQMLHRIRVAFGPR